MKKLLLIFILFPALLLAQTQVMAPFFTVFGTLKADSLAARSLNLTGNLTISGTLTASGAVNTPELTINSAYKFGRATGTNGQVLALTTASTPDTTYWTSYTADNGALWLRNAGAGYVYPNTATDMLGLNATPASPNKIYAINNGLAIQNNSGYKFYHMLDDTTSNPAGTYYPIGVDALTEIKTKKGQTYTIGATASGALLGNARISGKGAVSWVNCISSYPQMNDNSSATAITGFYSRAPLGNTNGTVDNSYAFYAADHTSVSFVTQGWGFYQVGSSDKNYFAGTVGIGTTAPDKKLEINSATGACMRHTYNDANGSAANYVDYSVSSSGDGTITPSGGDVNVAGYISTSQTVNQSTSASVTATQTASTLQTGAAYTGTDVTLSTVYIATKITASAAHTMGDFQIRVKESANITNTTAYFMGYIYADDGGSPAKPTGSALATGQVIRFGNITSSYQVLSLGTTYTMTNGVSYWLVLKVSATPTGGNLIFDSAVGANMGATSDDGTTWTNTTEQLYHVILGRTGRSISATNTNNYAGYFSGGSNYAVYGEAYNNYGVYGYSYNQAGVYGYSPYHYAVYGNSSVSYGGYFNSSTGTGLYASSAYILGECSVGSFVDRCEVYEDSALTALASIKKKPGAEKERGFSALDHQSLPGGIYTVKKHQVWQDKKTHARQPVGWTPPDSTAGNYEQVEYTEEGRDLSKLVSMLVKAMQEQHAINKAQEARIKTLEARVTKLEGK